MGNKNGQPILRDEDIKEFVISSGLTEQEVKKKFEIFIKDHPEGKISRAKFKVLLTAAIGKKTSKVIECTEKLEPHVFRVYDTDNDGEISFIEFMVVYHILAVGKEDEVLGKLFRLFDIDNNGSITKEEMTRLVNDLHYFLELSNKQDQVSAEQAFKEMDVNQDGSVSKEEFVKAVMEHKVASKVLTLNIIELFVNDNS
jgi:Ca2+-binding EF-hand superfamily protein